jgi:hypothetical protein
MQSAIMFFGISSGMLLCTAGVARVGGLGGFGGIEGAISFTPANLKLSKLLTDTIQPPTDRPTDQTQGTLTVGDTVLFLTLMAQLYGPLNFFGGGGGFSFGGGGGPGAGVGGSPFGIVCRPIKTTFLNVHAYHNYSVNP